MEETRIIKRVGAYSTSQADIEDCIHCHNAKHATVIIDGLCLDCFEIKVVEKQIVLKILKMAIPSLSPDGYGYLETALRELVKNRHIPLNIDKYLEELSDKKKRICCKMDCGKEAEYVINTDKPYDHINSCLEHIPELMIDADRHYIDKIGTEE